MMIVSLHYNTKQIMSVNRDKPLETVRPIRNQLCDLLQVKRPVLLSVCSKVFISIIQLVVYLTAFSPVSGCAHIVIWSFVRAVHWWMHQTITQRTWVQFPVVRVWVIGGVRKGIFCTWKFQLPLRKSESTTLKGLLKLCHAGRPS